MDRAHLTGHVWGALDECQLAPLDNKAAIFKHITTVLISIKDALREVWDGLDWWCVSQCGSDWNDPCTFFTFQMNELSSSSSSRPLEGVEEKGEGEGQETGTGASGRAEDEDDDEDITDFEPGQINAAERRTLEASIKLSEAAGKVLRAISKPLLQGVIKV